MFCGIMHVGWGEVSLGKGVNVYLPVDNFVLLFLIPFTTKKKKRPSGLWGGNVA